MSLSQSDLQFIDTYLINSGVRFTDIRIELTDHIASAVENKIATDNVSFYDAFKDFMAENKKHLLNEKRFSRSARSFTLSFYKQVFMQPLTLLFGALAFITVQFIFRNYKIDSMSLLWIFNGILLVISIFQLLRYKKNHRFSGVETIAGGLAIAHNVFLWMLLLLEIAFEDAAILPITFQVFATLFLTNILVYIVAEIKLRRLYRQRFSELL